MEVVPIGSFTVGVTYIFAPWEYGMAWHVHGDNVEL